MAESSSIEHLCEIKVLTSIEIYGKNATLANFQPVTCNAIKNPYMKRNLQVLSTLILLSLFTNSCHFIGNTFEYKKTTENFMNTLLKGDIVSS